jgi:ferrous iron transport protein B
MGDKTIALVGNPNTGKSTLFNALTGLRQKTGNYPGVTVERKAGRFVHKGRSFMVIDLPGTYSLNPRSSDETITYETLIGRFAYEQRPDLVVVVVDASNLERNLYLVSQVSTLELPVILALNMTDVAAEKGIHIEKEILSRNLGMPVIEVQANKASGIELLKDAIAHDKVTPPSNAWEPPADLETAVALLAGGWLAEHTSLQRGARITESLRLLQDPTGMSAYKNAQEMDVLRDQIAQAIAIVEEGGASAATHEILSRYQWIRTRAADAIRRSTAGDSITAKIDRVATHKIAGPVIFVAVLLTIFQSIFSWSAPLMDGIEALFALAGEFVAAHLPEGLFASLVVDGVLAGLGGVVIFLPQIMFLFFFISLLEGTGYMARAAFVMDGFMSRIGLHGRSVVPLISGFACAIPGIMATRTIENWRDRLLTMMILPFMACSARLPVYALLVSAFIPEKRILGVLPMQGLVFFGLYFFGIVVAIVAALVLKQFFVQRESVPFIMELPTYKLPNFKHMAFDMVERGWVFVKEAGQVIMVISLLLWFAANFPAVSENKKAEVVQGVPESQQASVLAAYQLRHSFAGKFGHAIEPLIAPLGFDWKIGIALTTSFAAREVVVGTLNTLYSVQESDEDSYKTLKEKLRGDINPETGTPVFTTLTALSLMLFYALSMQCMSTIAVVRRESNSWKWPVVMFIYMTVLAYLVSLSVFQIGTRLGF